MFLALFFKRSKVFFFFYTIFSQTQIDSSRSRHAWSCNPQGPECRHHWKGEVRGCKCSSSLPESWINVREETWQAASGDSRKKLDWLRRTKAVHKAVFMGQLHDAGGGARDVAGRGTPARNAIGRVRRTASGGICGGVKASVPLCEFASGIKSKDESNAPNLWWGTNVPAWWNHLVPPHGSVYPDWEIRNPLQSWNSGISELGLTWIW